MLCVQCMDSALFFSEAIQLIPALHTKFSGNPTGKALVPGSSLRTCSSAKGRAEDKSKPMKSWAPAPRHVPDKSGAAWRRLVLDRRCGFWTVRVPDQGYRVGFLNDM